MLRRRRLVVEALTALGLIAAPYVLPHLGFAPEHGQPDPDLGPVRDRLRHPFRLYRPVVVRTVGLLRHRRLYRGLSPDQQSDVERACGARRRHDRGGGGGDAGRRDRAAPHRHLFRDDHRGDRRDVLLHRELAARGLDRRRERPARRADPELRTRRLRRTRSATAGRCMGSWRSATSSASSSRCASCARRSARSSARSATTRCAPARSATPSALYKLTAFVIAAAYAGFAGGLLGVLQGFMPPDAFTFDTSGQLVMQTAIGGSGTLFGPLVGAAVWLFLRDFLQARWASAAPWKLVLGLVFVLLVCFLRRGLIGGAAKICSRCFARRPEPPRPKRRRRSTRRRAARQRRPVAAAPGDTVLRPGDGGARPHQIALAGSSPTATSTSRSSRASCAASSAPTAPARAPSSRC